MERVAELIERCAIYEGLYLSGNAPVSAHKATENLRRVFISLYTAILHTLCRLIRVFKGRTPMVLFDKACISMDCVPCATNTDSPLTV